MSTCGITALTIQTGGFAAKALVTLVAETRTGALSPRVVGRWPEMYLTGISSLVQAMAEARANLSRTNAKAQATTESVKA